MPREGPWVPMEEKPSEYSTGPIEGFMVVGMGPPEKPPEPQESQPPAETAPQVGMD